MKTSDHYESKMGVVDCSVIITCYNKEAFTEECINSVVRQTKQPKEIILVHDGCEAPATHINATSIIFPENKGVSVARNEGYRYSTGKLVLFLDGDDVISPDYLEKMILSISKGADIAYPQIFFWMKEGYLNKPPKAINPKLIKEKRKLAIPVTCLIKREVFDKVGGFRKFSKMEDLDFWLRAMCNGYTFKKADTLLWYRQEPGNRNQGELERKLVINEILSQFEITDQKICLK